MIVKIRMVEQGLFHELFEKGAYLIAGILGFFLRRFMTTTDKKFEDQNKKLEILDKRIDGHDVSRADVKAQISSLYNLAEKMDRKIDRLLDKK